MIKGVVCETRILVNLDNVKGRDGLWGHRPWFQDDALNLGRASASDCSGNPDSYRDWSGKPPIAIGARLEWQAAKKLVIFGVH